MKALLALPLLLAFACAGPSTATTPSTASGQSCGSMIPAVIYRNGQILAGPDSGHTVLATVKENTPVCASPDPQAFGFRKVKLVDGSIGYVADSSIAI